ncbi:hypothetical protein D3C84_999770 [compost metagenome]
MTGDDLPPRHHADNQEYRADIKGDDAKDHRAGHVRHVLRRVVGLGGGNGRDLGAAHGKNHCRHPGQHRTHAVRHEAAVIHQVAQQRTGAGRETEQVGAHDDDEDDDRENLQ